MDLNETGDGKKAKGQGRKGRGERGEGGGGLVGPYEEHAFRNSFTIAPFDRLCSFLRLVFCQRYMASGYAVYSVNTSFLFLPLSLYLFFLYLDELRERRRPTPGCQDAAIGTFRFSYISLFCT